MGSLVNVHADNRRDPLVYGRLDPAFLDRLADPRWNTIALDLYDDAGARLTGRVDTAGVQVAIAALTRCERKRPR